MDFYTILIYMPLYLADFIWTKGKTHNVNSTTWIYRYKSSGNNDFLEKNKGQCLAVYYLLLTLKIVQSGVAWADPGNKYPV